MKLNILKVKSRRVGYIRGGQRFGKEARYFPLDDEAQDNWPASLGAMVILDEDQEVVIFDDPHLISEEIEYDTKAEAETASTPADQTEAFTELIADIPKSDSGFDGDWEKAAKVFLRTESKARDLGKLTHIEFKRVDDRFNEVSFKIDGQPYAGKLEGIVDDSANMIED
jgi:hypothetical protein